MTFRTALMASAFGFGLSLASGAAFAVPVVGTSSGSFSNLTSCDDDGSNTDCGIVNSGGTNNQVRWPNTSNSQPVSDASTLTSVANFGINTATDANDIAIARLDWHNASTPADDTPDSFGVTWTLTVSFTQPNASSDMESLRLTIASPTNPPGDIITGMTLADLSNLSFSLNGVTVSDLKYSIADLGGNDDSTSCSGADTTLTPLAGGNFRWNNCEDNNAQLFITADFTAITQVPEPATLALLGAGLLGLGAIRRRRSV